MSDSGIIEPKAPRGRPFAEGNPGKPRGTKSKNTQLVERLVTSNPADVKAIIDVVVAEAKNGEAWAAVDTLASALARVRAGDADASQAFANRMETGLRQRLAMQPTPLHSVVETIVLAKQEAA